MIDLIENYIPQNYSKVFWLVLPCTVILFPLSWIFLYYIQYFGIYTARLTQLSILISFVYGFVIGVGTIFLVGKTDISSKNKMLVKFLSAISIIFSPLAFIIAVLITNSK